MRIRHVFRLAMFALPGLFCISLAGCGGGEQTSGEGTKESDAAEEKARSRVLCKRVSERLGSLEDKMGRLNDEIDKLQSEQARQIESLTRSAQALTDEVSLARREMTSKGAQPGSPATQGKKNQPKKDEAGPATVAESEAEGPSFVLRFVLVLIILGGIWILARIFLGRIEDEDDFDDDLDFSMDDMDDRQDTTFETDEGMISLSPEVSDAISDPESEGRDPGDSSDADDGGKA
jgi:hypothetical protein